MAFSRDDLKSYETKPQVQDPNHDPWGKNAADPQVKAETEADSSAEPVTEPTEEGIDGSSTETQAEPVAAEHADPEGEPELNEEPADGRPRNRAQERITELVDERNAVREYNKYLQSKLDELLRDKQVKPASDASPKTESQPEAENLPPTLESVGYDPVELNKKQNEWMQKQVNKQVREAVRQLETQKSNEAVAQAFQNRVTEFKKTAPDFDVVIANPKLPQLAPEAARIIVRSDTGPAVAYHIAKNPDIAVRIAKMDPVSQAAAIGRLEEQILRASQKVDTQEPSKAPKPVQTAKVTKAPPPPKPVSGGNVVTKSPGEMSMEEWVAHERGRKIAARVERQKMRQAMK